MGCLHTSIGGGLILESHGHITSSGIDLVEVWALWQKIIAPKARISSEHAMKP